MSNDFLLSEVKQKDKLRTRNRLLLIAGGILLVGLGSSAVYGMVANNSEEQTKKAPLATYQEAPVNSDFTVEPKPQTSEPEPAPAVSTPITNDSNNNSDSTAEQGVETALVHRDRSKFRDAAVNAADQLGEVRKLLEKRSFETEDNHISNIRSAQLQIIGARAAAESLRPSDKDPNVTAQQQATKDTLLRHATKLNEAVNEYHKWTTSKSPVAYEKARAINMESTVIGLRFYSELDDLPL